MVGNNYFTLATKVDSLEYDPVVVGTLATEGVLKTLNANRNIYSGYVAIYQQRENNAMRSVLETLADGANVVVPSFDSLKDDYDAMSHTLGKKVVKLNYVCDGLHCHMLKNGSLEEFAEVLGTGLFELRKTQVAAEIRGRKPDCPSYHYEKGGEGVEYMRILSHLRNSLVKMHRVILQQ